MIMPVQYDYAGAGLMRSSLGDAADPILSVNYSKKYDFPKFASRISDDWMPLYLAEFPKATPSFLPDEQDPGGESEHSTGAFIAGLASVRDGCAAPDSLESFRPSCLSADEWSSYVTELLPSFYEGEKKKVLEAAFFADPEIRRRLARSPLVPDDADAYFDDKKNWTKFWKESLTTDTDEALWARFKEDDDLWRAFTQKSIIK